MERIKAKYEHQLSKFHVQGQSIERLWNITGKCAEILYMLILIKNPKRILEIGTANGYSTFWLSLAAEKCNAVIDSIEMDEIHLKLAKENLKDRSNIHLHFGEAEFIVPTLSGKYDLVFIDAAKINYIDYLKSLLNKLEDNALIVADNVISRDVSVKEYLDFIKLHPCFVNMTLPIGAGLEISVFKKKCNVVETKET